MTSLKNILANSSVIRKILSTVVLVFAVYYSIFYINAGSYYYQQVAFRPFCICMGLLILINIKLKTWFNIRSLVYVPICYVFMHYACLGKWIPDVTNYEHVDVIRMGKLVALVWGIVVISLVYDAIKRKAWKNMGSLCMPIVVLWGLFCVLSFIFMHDYYYFLYMTIAFTALFYALSDKECRLTIADSLCSALAISLVYVYYKCLKSRPYDCERYTLYFANANSAGMYISAVVLAITIKLEKWWGYEGKKLVKIVMLVGYYVGLGVASGLLVFNFTRTTILGLLVAIFLKMAIKLKNSDNKKLIWKRFGQSFLTVILFVYPIFLSIRYIPGYFDSPYFFPGEYDPIVRVMPGDPIDSRKYTTIESYLTLALGKCGIYINFEPDKEAGETAVYYNEEKDVTNGRGTIWREYLAKMNVTGHTPANMTLSDGFFVYHAHNSYIHIAYQLGVIAGGVYLILMGVTFLVGIVAYNRCKAQDPSVLFAMCFGVAGVASQVTEWIAHPCYIMYATTFFAMGILIYSGNLFQKKIDNK